MSTAHHIHRHVTSAGGARAAHVIALSRHDWTWVNGVSDTYRRFMVCGPGSQGVTARRRVLCVGVVLAASSTAGCMSHAYMSSGAPPTVICGQTISNFAAGAVVTDATRGPAVTVTNKTAGDVVVLRLSDSCAYGATMTITPSAAMRITAEAHARDDRLAAAALRPIAAIADVVVAHPDGTSTIVHIRLTP
jgi:hypothetical protein